MPSYVLIALSFLIFATSITKQATSSSSSSDCDGDVVFSFPSFNYYSCEADGDLLCMGAAAISGDGFLNLTTKPPGNNSGKLLQSGPGSFATGRVLYPNPVHIWDTSFCTSFSLRIFPQLPNTGYGADGMAFVMVPSSDKSSGSHMGLQDQSLSGESNFKQLAIEFDTFKNEFDPDDNHIAIDTMTVEKSLVARSLNSSSIYLKSGKIIKVKIAYDGREKQLQIYVGYAEKPLVSFLNYSIKISKTIPQNVYIGFTASTGLLVETHQVLDWVFTSIPLPHSTSRKHKMLSIVCILSILMALILFVVCAFPIIRLRIVRKREMLRRMEDIDRQVAITTPTKFTYRQLAKATKNFSKDNFLGIGGFGSVYKGTFKDSSQSIAVKKISANSQQGEREYLAEICTIGRLKHKNILQLQGWCHENEQLLLVYDYMPNRSLHQFLIGKGFIDWNTRYKIITGLASALLYLHEECGDPVVHRDVKPSNVMLDSEFNPHLGDFGLARLLTNMGGVTTVVAGTLGYMAPEVGYTGKATTESDVYSFGVVALEVVCGKRFYLLGDDNLVDYVWDMYMQGSLLECVDPKLNGDFEQDQAARILSIALVCMHLDSNLRPKMRKVVQVLMNPDEPLMDIPDSQPSEVHVSLHGFSRVNSFNPHTTNFS